MATKGSVIGVIANMVTLTVDGPVSQNEICYITTGGDRLMAEVIKVVGANAYVQVFESTRGLKVGAEAEFTGHMLEVTLGPGMLSKNYDGLQNDLDKMEGVFLKRGQYTYPLDKEAKWNFKPIVEVGDEVGPSAWLGEVEENHQPLKIMVPFQLTGTYKVKSIVPEGEYTIEDTVAVLTDKDGNDIPVNMIQKWPVKKAMTNYREKPRPFRLLETGVRVIDTLNPIVEGGTGFIPGPFCTGKTVLQHAISKQAEADIVRCKFREASEQAGGEVGIDLIDKRFQVLPVGLRQVLGLTTETRHELVTVHLYRHQLMHPIFQLMITVSEFLHQLQFAGHGTLLVLPDPPAQHGILLSQLLATLFEHGHSPF